jgi:hypothetical protein
MRHRLPPWIVVVLVASLAAGSVAAADNQTPTAAAGLDQTVTSGTTVYLDAGNSKDPDGSIESVSWSIQAPNGSTITPSCRRCTTPTFTPDTTGRWTATVTVTDDSGATATDTLYVTVDAPRGPSISVTAPDTAVRGQSTPVIVDTQASSADLRSVALYHDGTRVDQTDVSGQRASVELSHTFSADGTNELRATVTDEDGYVNTTTVSIDVVAPSQASVSSFGGSVPSCDDPSAERVYRNGEPGNMCSSSGMVIDMAGGERVVSIRTAALETGIRLYSPRFGKVVNMTSPEQTRELQREAGNSAILLEKVHDIFHKNVENGNIGIYNDTGNDIGTDHEISVDQEVHEPTIATKSRLDRGERMAEYSSSAMTDTSCCSNGHDSTSPRPGNRKNYATNMDSEDSTTARSGNQNGGQNSAVDSASDSNRSADNTGCPPPEADVPTSVEQRLC